MTAPRPRRTDRHRWVIPALWLLAPVVVWLIGPAASLSVASMSVHDTYYVDPSHHLVLSTGAFCLIFAAVYALLGLVLRLDYRQPPAWAHLGLTWLGLALISAPALLLPLVGMPERFEGDPIEALGVLNQFTTAGYGVALAGAVAFLILLGDLFLRWIRKKPGSPLSRG